MFFYQLGLAWKSVVRNPVLSSLIALGIALGVGVATTFLALFHILSADPVPGKSELVHFVRVDSWGRLTGSGPCCRDRPDLLAYKDTMALLKSGIPEHQTPQFPAQLSIYPPRKDMRPFREPVRLAYGDLFAMFGAPFRYGAAWDKAADAAPAAVVVIGDEMNQRLFGGENSVGKTLRIEDRDFRVIGVLGPWRPSILPYDQSQNALQEPDQVFLPFNWVIPMEIASSGNGAQWRSPEDYANFTDRIRDSEAMWLQLWVELKDARQKAAYQRFVEGYVADQKKHGRMPRPQGEYLTSLPALIEEWGVVPRQTKALAAISVLFLAVASVNLIGLFLGKFLARAPIVGIRRALGASRRAIFVQHLLEAELIGIVGGVAGIGLAAGVLALLNKVFSLMTRSEGHLALDLPMIGAAVLLSLAAGAVAGLYPAWRICTEAPARHLKNA
jgi:putative ABC transport system permease protein